MDIRGLGVALMMLSVLVAPKTYAAFSTHGEIQEFIEGFHGNPSPGKVADLMNYSVSNNLLYETSSRYSIVSFLVGAMDRYRHSTWYKAWEQQIKEYDEDSFSALSIPIRYQPSQYTEVLKGLPVSTIYVDSLWGLYFGTGDEKYLSSLMNIAASEAGEDINHLIAKFSARTSLANHANNLPGVNDFLETEKLYGAIDNRDLAARIVESEPAVFMNEAKLALSELMQKYN